MTDVEEARPSSAPPPAPPAAGPTPSAARAGKTQGVARAGKKPWAIKILRTALSSVGTLRLGLAALLTARHPLLLVYAVVAVIVGIVATVAPAVPSTAAWLATIGFGDGHHGKLIGAAVIYDVVTIRGLWYLLRGVGFLDRERRALDQIDTRCSDYLERLDRVSVSLVGPENPFVFGGSARDPMIAATSAYKMTENIRLDAAGRRFDPVNLIVERVLGNVVGHSLSLREAQQFGVRLGILGTFVGIVFSLGNVGPIVQSAGLDNAAIQAAINSIVGSLGIAFSTSIAGLGASILLQLMAGNVRSRENELIEALERQAGRVQIVCRRASEDTPLGEDIAALRSVLDEHTHFMRRQEKDMMAVSSRFGDALTRTENTLSGPIAALEQTGRRLGDLLATQSAAVGGLERMTAAVSDLETRVAGHFEAAAARSAETQKAALLDMAQALRLVSTRLLEEIRGGWGADAREAIETLVDRRLADAATRLDEAAERQRRAMNRLAALLAAATAGSAAALLLLAGSASGVYAWIAARLAGG